MKNICRASKHLATNVMKNSGGALENCAKIGNASVFKNPKAASFGIPDVISFYPTGKSINISENLYGYQCET